MVYVDTYIGGRACVAFGEQRGSDELFVDCWQGQHDINPPTYADADYERAFDGRRGFPAGAIEAAAEYAAGALASGLDTALGQRTPRKT